MILFCIKLEKLENPLIVEYLTNCQIDLVINIPTPNPATKYSEILKDEYGIRRLAIEFSIPVLTNLELALTITNILKHHDSEQVSTRSLNEYMDQLEWAFW